MSKKESSKVVAKVESGNDSDTDDKNLLQVCNPPHFMSAVMRRQVLHEMVKSLPKKVQNRVVALKNIQLEQLELEAQFYEEVYSLEKKYHEKYQPLFDKRKEIVAGSVDPPEQTPKWKESEDLEITERVKDISLKMKDIKPALSEDVEGIPNFWLTIFRNTEILSEMVQEHDEPLLKKLRDIQIKYVEDKEHSYTLEFHFDKNEYFSNPILTKQYFLKAAIEEEYPFSFEGPEIYKCKGCNINWEKGMNLTVKTIRKKQKHKERGAVRTITKQVPNDSFFNFFKPPEIPDDKSEVDEDSQGILATDFEIGHFLRARIIPKAVLYYTGDIVDDEDDDGDEYDEEEEEDEEDEGDEDVAVQKTAGNKKKQSPNDCPNQ
ncbi:nucleosome assembly protein 1-like 1 [Eupeodes corollae]|uniref:nucleosome assembly protein 1-like 1 n=1 Tax=Eupeodes corollae TaxID=290404 RepID=UPI0024918B95|nr:nucleosome assembly protein 1-like 1 [Eupeodes corollae]